MQKFSTLTIAAAALFVTGTLATRAPALTPDQIFQKIDKDNSGFIEIEECREWLVQNGAPEQHIDSIIEDFWASDLNKDGVVSREEWNSLHNEQPRVPAGFARRPNNSASSSSAHAPAHPNDLTSSRTRNHRATIFATDKDDETKDDETKDDETKDDETKDNETKEDGEEENEDDVFLWVDFTAIGNSHLCPEDAVSEQDCTHKVYYNDEAGTFEVCALEKDTDELICYNVKVTFDEDNEEGEGEEEEEQEDEEEEEESSSESNDEDSSSSASGEEDSKNAKESNEANEEGSGEKADEEVHEVVPEEPKEDAVIPDATAAN